MPENYVLDDGRFVCVLPRGGRFITRAFTRVDEAAMSLLTECASRWPYENREAVDWIKDKIGKDPTADLWIVCDTAFFSTLPEKTARYAIPPSFAAQGYRRYGADGLFHQWVAHQYPADRRIISVCLGDNPNAAAISRRKPVDTTAGYSRLDGSLGRCTCGDLDPAILLSLADDGVSPQEISSKLYEASGWKAVSEGQYPSADGTTQTLAGQMLFNQTIKMVGAMLASMGGADLIAIGMDDEMSSTKLLAELRTALSFITLPIQVHSINREEIVEKLSSLDD